MSEVDWVCQRAHLRHLLHQHPDWSIQQLADAVGCSKSWVSRWKRRLSEASPGNVAVLFSRSRAPHHHPPRIAPEVKERLVEMRLAPPDGLKRTPGPKALLYYIQKDEALCASGHRLPRSTRTVWRLLDEAGLIQRDEPFAHSPLPLCEPMQEVQMDFKDASTVRPDSSNPAGKRQHLIEVCNFVDAGTSILLSAQVLEDFHAETAFRAVVAFLRQYGLPRILTFDRDVRWVGSSTQRDFPSALVQFLYCVGVQPNILPPQHPELNCYVERYHKSYKKECLEVYRPSTLEEVRNVTQEFEQHYNTQRPHQGRSCQNQPPRVAHPDLPKLPALPETVDPDCWLIALHGRWYPRRIKADGRIQIDGVFYYIKQALAGQQILVRLNAQARSFEVVHQNQIIKQLPIKGLRGEPMPLESYIEWMSEQARSEERQRVLRKHRLWQRGQQTS